MWTWRWSKGENLIQISISFNKLTNVSIFLRIYLVKKPFALIVCLALLMNPNILQLLLIEIWSAKFFVKILQVHNVLATIHTMQFYFRWFYWKSVWHQLYYSFVMFQEGEQYIFLFRLIFSCMALFKILHRFLLQGCVVGCLNIALLKLKKSYLHVHMFYVRNEKVGNLKFF